MKTLKPLASPQQFQAHNNAYSAVFRAGKMSVGLVAPIENYVASPVPTMHEHLERVQLAEQLGFSAVWLRDVPFNVPSFGDAGQLYDPFVYLGFLAAHTKNIALGVASMVLPLRHPAHVAKAAASVDVISGGRLLLGVASGDRAAEYPAMNLSYDDRGERFRASFDYIRHMQSYGPELRNQFGTLTGEVDLLPKPTAQLPLLVTGWSQQSPEWIAANGDGWMLYPRDVAVQRQIIIAWHERVRAAGRPMQPVMQPLYFALASASQSGPQPLHLGFSASPEYLVDYLKSLEAAGVNHVALNLRYNQHDMNDTLETLAKKVLPAFNHTENLEQELS